MKSKNELQWIIHFDGAVSANDRTYCACLYSYKLYFECTDSVAEYEALILGVNILNKFKAKKVFIYGDLELVIN